MLLLKSLLRLRRFKWINKCHCYIPVCSIVPTYITSCNRDTAEATSRLSAPPRNNEGGYKEFVFLLLARLLARSAKQSGRVARSRLSFEEDGSTGGGGGAERGRRSRELQREEARNGGRGPDLIKKGAVSSIWRRREKKKARTRETKGRRSGGTPAAAAERRHARERNVPPNAERKTAHSFSAVLRSRHVSLPRKGNSHGGGKRDDGSNRRTTGTLATGGMRWLGSLKLSSVRKISLFATAK